jgi:hypothetical protein
MTNYVITISRTYEFEQSIDITIVYCACAMSPL